MGGRQFKRWYAGFGVAACCILVLAVIPSIGPASSQTGEENPEVSLHVKTPANQEAGQIPATSRTAQAAQMSKEKKKGNGDLVEQGLFKPTEAAIRGKTARGQTILDAPAFTVPPRKSNLEFYPCTDCHEGEEVNPIERTLEEEHDTLVLEHGGGRFWCLTCHSLNDRNNLISLKDKPIDFDQSYLLCGQCHFQRQKDWYFGGHGKRIAMWRGERQIYNCTECHDPHSPSIKPFEPKAPPQVRKGLVRLEVERESHLDSWEVRVRTMEKGERHE